MLIEKLFKLGFNPYQGILFWPTGIRCTDRAFFGVLPSLEVFEVAASSIAFLYWFRAGGFLSKKAGVHLRNDGSVDAIKFK